MRDTARVLGRLNDGIACCGFPDGAVEEIAGVSGLPVWNGLSDEAHTSQVLADLLTMRELGDIALHQLTQCHPGATRSSRARSL